MYELESNYKVIKLINIVVQSYFNASSFYLPILIFNIFCIILNIHNICFLILKRTELFTREKLIL